MDTNDLCITFVIIGNSADFDEQHLIVSALFLIVHVHGFSVISSLGDHRDYPDMTVTLFQVPQLGPPI